MLKALGIYSGLFSIVAVMFLLDNAKAFDSFELYLWCAAMILFSLMFAIKKTVDERRLRKMMDESLLREDEEV